MASKKRIFTVVTLALLAVILSGLMASPALGQQPPRVKVLIGFAQQPGPAEQALVRRAGGKIKYTYHLVPAIAASVPEPAIDGLRRNPNVTIVELDGQVQAVDAELDNAWGVKRIGSGAVHDAGNTGDGVTIAIIDSGVDYSHPDLDGNYVGGWDFVDADNDPTDPTHDGPMDVYGHGTHVAGTACAEVNEFGVVGVAPGCALYSLRVLDGNGFGSFSDVIAAMEWAVDNGMQVANLSLGWDRRPGDTFKAAFDNAWLAGLVTVAAAGNSGNWAGRGKSVAYPAMYDSVIAVAATDADDVRASFSSTGPEVELAAPGVSVLSTWNDSDGYYDPQPVCLDNVCYYKEGSGTSMASPHVAGTAALIIASGITNNDEVRQRLQETADDLGDPGRDPLYGFGLVDADEAAAGPPEPAVNVALSTDKPEYVSVVDSVAVLTAVVTDETGAAISGLEAEAFETALGDAPAVASFGETDTDGTYTADLAIYSLAMGPHEAVVTVTGPGSIVGSDTASFSIVSEPTIKTILAESTNFRTVTRGKSGKVQLLLDVHVVEGNTGGSPVACATVSVSITTPDATPRTLSGDTDSNGVVTLAVDGDPQSGTWTAVVTNINEPGYQFVPTGDTEAEITL